MFCTHCGNKMDENTAFCTGCGAATQKTAPPPTAQPVTANPPLAAYVKYIIAAIAAVAVLAGGGFLVWGRVNAGAYANQPPAAQTTGDTAPGPTPGPVLQATPAPTPTSTPSPSQEGEQEAVDGEGFYVSDLYVPTPVPSEGWRMAYALLLREYAAMWGPWWLENTRPRFVLHDIDGDGVPELLVKWGHTCQDWWHQSLFVYTFINGESYAFGEVYGWRYRDRFIEMSVYNDVQGLF